MTGGRRVVVTGYGMVTPLGRGAEATFARAAQGHSGISSIRSFDPRGLPCRIGGEVDDAWLDPLEDGLPPALQGRTVRLLLSAAGEAARQARLDEVKARDRVGVVLGCHGENPRLPDLLHLHRFTDGHGAWDVGGLLETGGYDPFQFLRRKPDVTAALLARHLSCRGSCLAVASACAAGAQAIGEATRLIRDGRCDLVVTGGCESNLSYAGFVGFVLLRALAERYDSPETASRPFDRRRSGFVVSEGAGVVVVEALEHARERGVAVLGEVLGYGDSADAFRITDARPDGAGALLAMRRALADAALGPAEVDYVNAHATSTPQGDLAEARAIRELFGARTEQVPVSSNKSMLGHTIAAAGAIECILTLIGLTRSLLLPTVNHQVPDPRCNLDVVPNVARRQECRVALSSSFGFGGQNACLCLGRGEG